MTNDMLATAFNEWHRRNVEDPARTAKEFSSFGSSRPFGERMTDYLHEILFDINGERLGS